MKHFTIDNESNNISVHATAQEAEAVANAERFRSEAGLDKIAADWPMARLVEIWNTLPGVNPVSKFKDRATAVTRIWKAVQTLAQTEPNLAEAEPCADQTAEVVTEVVVGSGEQPATDPTQRETVAAEVMETASATTVGEQAPDVVPTEPAWATKRTRKKKADTAQTGVPREGSKASQVIALLKRSEGATVEEIMAAMKWQKHTTRALLSAGGSLTKNHGLTVVSEKTGDHRRYFIKS